jgi:hypothetical protein
MWGSKVATSYAHLSLAHMPGQGILCGGSITIF